MNEQNKLVGTFNNYPVYMNVTSLVGIPDGALLIDVDCDDVGYVSHFTNGYLRGIDVNRDAQIAIAQATRHTMETEFPLAYADARRRYLQDADAELANVEATQESFLQSARGM